MEITQLLLVIAFFTIIFLIILLLLPRIRRQRSNTSDNSLEIQTIPHPFAFKGNPNNPLNKSVVDAVNRMGGVGNEAEAEYQTSIDVLRQNVEAVVSIVSAEYKDLPETRYLDRWSLIQLLAELTHPSSLAVLDDVLSSPIPPEQSKNPSSFSTVGEEVMIRTTAVEAMTRIGAKENPEALQLLLKHVQHENFSVKRACIQGYLVHGGKAAREKLLKVLPESDRYILDIRREDVRNVPQPEAGKYIRKPNSHDSPRMPSPYKAKGPR